MVTSLSELISRKFISGLVLGAGASTRFGQPKQMLPFNGTTLLGWVVGRARQAEGLDEVIVVLGRAAEEIRRVVDFGGAKVIDNPIFGEGCSSSYRAGIGALDQRSEAVMIILGDQPGISLEIINSVADHWRQADAPIVITSYRGRKGHPMIFGRSLFGDLVELHGDKAAWRLVDAHQDLLSMVEFDLPLQEDINTREDLERVSSLLK